MKKHFWLILLGIFILGAGSAFALDDASIQKQYDPVINNIFAALKSGDRTAFTKDFDQRMKEEATAENFQKMRENFQQTLGEVKSLKYLGYIDKTDYVWIMWKGNFTATEQEILVQIVLSKGADGTYQVAGLAFK